MRSLDQEKLHFYRVLATSPKEADESADQEHLQELRGGSVYEQERRGPICSLGAHFLVDQQPQASSAVDN